MPGAAVNVGTSTTVAFGTSGFVAEITSVRPFNVTVQTFRTTHMTTTKPTGSQQGGHTYIASKFGDFGELQIEGHFNPQQALPGSGVFETATVTAPLVLGDSTSATWVGSACLTNFQPTIPYDDLMTFTATWKWSGIPTFTPAT
jgi:hypothetical protein